VLIVSAILMHYAVIYICCRSGRERNTFVLLVTVIVIHCAVI